MKADKAWTQRYMKKHGKVGQVTPDGVALNAEREKQSLTCWKEQRKHDSNMDKAALVKMNAQTRQEQAPDKAGKINAKGGADGGSIMDKLRKSNYASDFVPIDRAKGMPNALGNLSDLEEGERQESEVSEKHGDFRPRKVGEKRLPGNSETSLGVVADDGAVEEEVVTGRIWTVYAQTMSHIEEDSDIFLQEELEAALSDFADDATHQ